MVSLTYTFMYYFIYRHTCIWIINEKFPSSGRIDGHGRLKIFNPHIFFQCSDGYVHRLMYQVRNQVEGVADGTAAAAAAVEDDVAAFPAARVAAAAAAATRKSVAA